MLGTSNGTVEVRTFSDSDTVEDAWFYDGEVLQIDVSEDDKVIAAELLHADRYSICFRDFATHANLGKSSHDNSREFQLLENPNALLLGGDSLKLIGLDKTNVEFGATIKDTTRLLDDYSQLASSRNGSVVACVRNQSELLVFSRLDPSKPILNVQTRSTFSDVCFSPDGRHLAAATTNGIIQTFDLDSRKLIHEFVTGDSIKSINFFPDGRWLAGCTESGVVTFHDIETGEETIWPIAHQRINGFKISPSGDQLVTYSYEFTGARIWDLTTLCNGMEIGDLSLANGVDTTRSSRLSPDSRYLCTWNRGESNELTIRDRLKGDSKSLSLSFPASEFSVQFSDDGKFLAVFANKTMDIISCEDGLPSLIKNFPTHIKAIAFSPRNRFVACNLQSDEVVLLPFGEAPKAFGEIRCVASDGSFNQSETFFIGTGSKNSLAIVDLAKGVVLDPVILQSAKSALPAVVRKAKFVPNSDDWAMITSERQIGIVNIRKPDEAQWTKGYSWEITKSDVSYDGTLIVCLYQDGKIEAIDSQKLSLHASTEVSSYAGMIGFWPDSRIVFVATSSCVELFDSTTMVSLCKSLNSFVYPSDNTIWLANKPTRRSPLTTDNGLYQTFIEPNSVHSESTIGSTESESVRAKNWVGNLYANGEKPIADSVEQKQQQNLEDRIRYHNFLATKARFLLSKNNSFIAGSKYTVTNGTTSPDWFSCAQHSKEQIRLGSKDPFVLFRLAESLLNLNQLEHAHSAFMPIFDLPNETVVRAKAANAILTVIGAKVTKQQKSTEATLVFEADAALVRLVCEKQPSNSAFRLLSTILVLQHQFRDAFATALESFEKLGNSSDAWSQYIFLGDIESLAKRIGKSLERDLARPIEKTDLEDLMSQNLVQKLEEPLLNAMTRNHAMDVNKSFWNRIRKPGTSIFSSNIAQNNKSTTFFPNPRSELDILKLASEQFPSGAILNTLGVALYREGLCQESIEALNRSVDLYKAKNNSSEPSNSAFLALCHHKLGNLDEAKKHRAMFDEAMKDEQNSKDEDNLNFQKEVNEAFADAAKE